MLQNEVVVRCGFGAVLIFFVFVIGLIIQK
jgi:hypothetical protein